MSCDPLVTIGEALGVLTSNSHGPMIHASAFRLRICGAELNVAVGVRRLGHPTTWVGRVGNDPVGDLVVRELHAEKVTVLAKRDDYPTGLMFKERRTADLTLVHYWRRNSAGSRLSVDDLPEERIRAASVLHVSGVTAALGEGPHAAVMAAIEIAQEHNVQVSFDVNYRSRLWSPHDAAPVLRDLIKQSDLVFCGEDEAALVTNDTGSRLLEALAALGPSTVLLKHGPAGADALINEERLSAPAVPAHSVDAVGAGDAFAAGYLAARLHGWSAKECLETATHLGAIAVSTDGDWEGLPHLHELETFADREPVHR